MYITQKQKIQLSKYVEDLERFIQDDNLNGILDILDEKMLDALDENQEGTLLSAEIAILYDELYIQN